MFQSGLSGEQPSAFGQLGPPARAFPGAAGVLRAAGRLGETGEQQGEQPQPERDDVDQQDGAQPTRAEQDGGEHRTEQLGPGQGGLGHRAGPAALFGPDHARDGGGERLYHWKAAQQDSTMMTAYTCQTARCPVAWEAAMATAASMAAASAQSSTVRRR